MRPLADLNDAEAFEAVRAEVDPVAQARMAGMVIRRYAEQSLELGRLRAAAIEAAAMERGMTYGKVAKEIGLTQSRVSQIRTAARSR